MNRHAISGMDGGRCAVQGILGPHSIVQTIDYNIDINKSFITEWLWQDCTQKW